MQESSALRELIKNHGIQTEDDINAIIADLSQLVSIFSEADVTRRNFPCDLPRNVGKKTHCKMQKTCYTLQSRALTCNSLKESMQQLQK